MHLNSNTLAGKTDSPVEWPTWVLIISVYSSWLGGLAFYHELGHLPAGLLLVLTGAIHMSVQHELLHGHPTRSDFINGLIAYPPITLLFPYPIYKATHITHHYNPNLTIPGVDPESFYVRRQTWESSHSVIRAFYTFRMTLFGRLATGPAYSALLLSRDLLSNIAHLSVKGIVVWTMHLLLVALLLYWVSEYFEIPVWHYLIIAYLANALAMLRSFYEHRAVENIDQRSVIIECGWFFQLLFLNNNYHFLHHQQPAMPWYRLPAAHRKTRAESLQRNGIFTHPGYSHWVSNNMLKPVDSPIHPFSDEDFPNG